MVDLIKKKKNGQALSKEEYTTIIQDFVKGAIPDYQMAAFLMAVYFQGMDSQETAILTEAMMHSGELIDLSEIEGIKVDKHSTGGVGDKTSIILAPLVAAAGVPVAKMSGRGLGHTGGTLDKLESIKGFSINLSRKAFIEQVKQHSIAICGQNATLVPADKMLYALRDVTATVDNISLISSSIMSKKLACGADAMVIDIKLGSGAYMKTVAAAEDLAKVMIETGRNMNRKVVVVISNMDQPLGCYVGNALEIKEAIDTLQGKGPKDLTDLCLTLGAYMLVLGEKAPDYDTAIQTLKELIDSGKAFQKFKEFVQLQGGTIGVVEQTELLPQSAFSQDLISPKTGYIHHLDALAVGLASMKLGAGRETKESEIDYGAGIILKKKVGDYIEKGETLAILYSSEKSNFDKAQQLLDKAYQIEPTPAAIMPLVIKIIEN